MMVWRDFGQRQLGGEAGGGAGEGGHAGDDLVGDAERIEAAHLFGDGAIDRGIAGMDAGDVLARVMGGGDLGDDLIEMHRRGVADQRAGGRGGDDFGGDERAGIEADRAALDEALAAQGDEVGRAGAGADEVDGHAIPWGKGPLIRATRTFSQRGDGFRSAAAPRGEVPRRMRLLAPSWLLRS